MAATGPGDSGGGRARAGAGAARVVWWEVLVALAVPAWLLGFVLRVFAPAEWLVLAALALGIAAYGAVMALWPSSWWRTERVAFATTLLCIPLLLLPVLDPLLRGAPVGDRAGLAEVPAIYGFRAANGDPRAFNAWWTKYFDTWQTVQPRIEQKDPTGLLRAMPIPGASAAFMDGEIRINNRGFRGKDMPAEKGNAFRIFTLGASPTFGQSVFRESRPWTAVLGDLIDSRYTCRRPIEIYNGGVNGYRIPDSINRLRRDIAPLQPDLVISYHGYNGMEFLVDDLPEMAAPTLPPLDAGALTQAWLRLDFFLRSGWAQLRGIPAVLRTELLGAGSLDDIAVLRNSAYYRHYERLIETAQQIGSDLALASFSMAVDDRSPPEALRFYASVFHNNLPGLSWMQRSVAGMAAHNLMVADLSRRHDGVLLLDSRPGLNGEFDKDYFIDIVHLTPAGDRKLAENLLADLEGYLIRNPTLSCRRK